MTPLLLLLWLALAPASDPVNPEIPCQSFAGERRECVVGSFGRIALVRELSDNACFEGVSWGTNSQGVVWVERGCQATFTIQSAPEGAPRSRPLLPTVVCQAEGDERRHCPADTKFGVAIARQLGEGACALERTWGFDAEGVWVSGGCRAQFALGGYRLPANAVPRTAKRVVCRSSDGKEARCGVDASKGVGLVRQLSKVTCVLNRTWGYDEKGIWVSGGCAADFAVAK